MDGALGTGDTLALTPRPVLGAARYVDLAASERHTCAVRASGEVDCWGDNTFGQLGDGTTVARPVPTMVRSAERFTQVSVSSATSCAVAQGGRAFCWGANGSFQLDVSDPALRLSTTPVRVAAAYTARAVGAGANFGCVLTSDGEVACWGSAAVGARLGRGQQILVSECSPQYCDPRLVSGGRRYEALAVGSGHSCARGTDGATYCWGRSILGGAGVGTGETDVWVPTRVAMP